MSRAARKGNVGGKNGLLLAAALGILLITVLSYASSQVTSTDDAASSPAQAPRQPPNLRPGYMERVDLLAQQCGGNWRQLSAADQNWLEKMLRGNAAEVIRARAKTLKSEGR